MIAALATRLHVPPWVLEAMLAVILVFAFVLYERHQGARNCVANDQLAVAHDEQKAASAFQLGLTTVFQEDADYDRAIHAPIEHPVHVRLCQPSGSGPTAQDSTPASSPDAAASVRAAATADPLPDIGPGVLTLGRDADAQVRGLQGYIRDVCPVR